MKIMMVNIHGGGIQYYRNTVPADALRAAGHEVVYNDYEFGFFNYLMNNKIDLEEYLGEMAKDVDVVHMGYTTLLDQTTLINGAFRNFALKQLGRSIPVITDIDDDPHSVPPYNTAFRAFQPASPEKKAVVAQLRTSDAVTVTTQPIKESLVQDAKNISVLPNYCNPADWDYPVDPRRGDDASIRVMFVGGHGHYGDLSEVREAIEWMVERYDGKGGKPHVKLIWLGCTPDWAAKWLQDKRDPLANRAYYVQPCLPNIYRQAIRWIQPDIMFAPIQPNDFNKSKSDIKAYDAAFGGAAFLHTDFDTYDDIPAQVSCKATSPTQWKEWLGQLIENPSLRAQKAKQLKEWVLENRVIKDHIYKWERVYEAAMEEPVIQDMSDVTRPRIITGA